jgi:hypothetical protein
MPIQYRPNQQVTRSSLVDKHNILGSFGIKLKKNYQTLTGVSNKKTGSLRVSSINIIL